MTEPNEATVASVAPTFPPAEASVKTGFAKNPYLGWLLGSWILIGHAIVRVTAAILVVAKGDHQQSSRSAESVLGIAVFGSVLMLIAATGLMRRQRWGQQLTLVLVGLGVVADIVIANYVDPRTLPGGSALPTTLGAIFLLLGWLLLLDEPAKLWRAITGGVIVGGAILAGSFGALFYAAS